MPVPTQISSSTVFAEPVLGEDREFACPDEALDDQARPSFNSMNPSTYCSLQHEGFARERSLMVFLKPPLPGAEDVVDYVRSPWALHYVELSCS